MIQSVQAPVPRYESVGRMCIRLRRGDLIWYYFGRDGFDRGRIIDIVAGHKPLVIQRMQGDNPIGAPIRRGTSRIISTWRAGRCLALDHPFSGRVESYLAPGPGCGGRDLGWTSVLHGFDRVVTCSSVPGWPTRALSVGEIVRCEMRNVPGREPMWFILAGDTIVMGEPEIRPGAPVAEEAVLSSWESFYDS